MKDQEKAADAQAALLTKPVNNELGVRPPGADNFYMPTRDLYNCMPVFLHAAGVTAGFSMDPAHQARLEKFPLELEALIVHASKCDTPIKLVAEWMERMFTADDPEQAEAFAAYCVSFVMTIASGMACNNLFMFEGPLKPLSQPKMVEAMAAHTLLTMMGEGDEREKASTYLSNKYEPLCHLPAGFMQSCLKHMQTLDKAVDNAYDQLMEKHMAAQQETDTPEGSSE